MRPPPRVAHTSRLDQNYKNFKRNETNIGEKKQKKATNIKIIPNNFEALMIRPLKLLSNKSLTVNKMDNTKRIFVTDKSEENTSPIKQSIPMMESVQTSLPSATMGGVHKPPGPTGRAEFKHFPARKKQKENVQKRKVLVRAKKSSKKMPVKIIELKPILTNNLESHENEKNYKNLGNDERKLIIETLVNLKEKVDRKIYNGLQLNNIKTSNENTRIIKTKPKNQTERKGREKYFKPSRLQTNNWTPIFNPSEKILNSDGRDSRLFEPAKDETKVYELKKEILVMKKQILNEMNDFQKLHSSKIYPTRSVIQNPKQRFSKRNKKENFNIFKNVNSFLSKTSNWLKL